MGGVATASVCPSRGILDVPKSLVFAAGGDGPRSSFQPGRSGWSTDGGALGRKVYKTRCWEIQSMCLAV